MTAQPHILATLPILVAITGRSTADQVGADQVQAFAAMLAPAAMLTAPTYVPEACQYIKQIIFTISLSEAAPSGHGRSASCASRHSWSL